MSYETLFSLLNLSVFPAWLLLIFLPRSGLTGRLVHSGLYPLLLGAFYIIVMGYELMTGAASEGANFTSVAGVSAIFATPLGVLVGWSHYLVFDLFVGAWIARDSQRRGIGHLWTVPCLILTFVFGPVGLFGYVLMRLGMGKGGLTLSEDRPVTA